MAKQKQKLITAQHVERTNHKGDPLVKQFTESAWNDMPMVDYMTNEGRVKRAKGGWVLTGEKTGAKAPEPLKAKEPTVQQTPKPITPRPTPVAEGNGGLAI
jgi:hypothetical protein